MDSRYGAVILCGGESSRMGRDKAWLPWGTHTTLLQNCVEILEHVVPRSHLVVVGGRDQRLPPLSSAVTIVRGTADGAGPLPALIAGLDALPPGVEWAFACGCDAPFMQRDFVVRMFELPVNDVDAIVPAEGERLHPLAAVYGKNCLPGLQAVVAAGERSLHRALRSEVLRVREVPVEELRAVDAELDSLLNCNTPEEYDAALLRYSLRE